LEEDQLALTADLAAQVEAHHTVIRVEVIIHLSRQVTMEEPVMEIKVAMQYIPLLIG